MLREISEEVRVNMKDRLREVRQAIRRHRHDSDAGHGRAGARAPFPLAGIEALLGRAVSAFDDAATMAETLVPRGRFGGQAALTAPKPLGRYFSARDPLAGERAFRRDLYGLAKVVLAVRGIEGVTIRETRFPAIHAAIARDEAEALGRLEHENAWTQRVALVAGLSAALLVELVRHDPLCTGDAPRTRPLDRPQAIACLAPMALACGLATMEADARCETDLLEIAMLAVDARLDRILDAFAGADPRVDLTAIFAALLAHLP